MMVQLEVESVSGANLLFDKGAAWNAQVFNRGLYDEALAYTL